MKKTPEFWRQIIAWRDANPDFYRTAEGMAEHNRFYNDLWERLLGEQGRQAKTDRSQEVHQQL